MVKEAENMKIEVNKKNKEIEEMQKHINS